jgi:hypothetical protein
MIIKITAEQLAKMEVIYKDLSSHNFESKESKVAKMEHFLQIISDLNYNSTFSTSLRSYIPAFKRSANQYESTTNITTTMREAIDYYKQS